MKNATTTQAIETVPAANLTRGDVIINGNATRFIVDAVDARGIHASRERDGAALTFTTTHARRVSSAEQDGISVVLEGVAGWDY